MHVHHQSLLFAPRSRRLPHVLSTNAILRSSCIWFIMESIDLHTETSRGRRPPKLICISHAFDTQKEYLGELLSLPFSLWRTAWPDFLSHCSALDPLILWEANPNESDVNSCVLTEISKFDAFIASILRLSFYLHDHISDGQKSNNNNDDKFFKSNRNDGHKRVILIKIHDS